MGPVNAPEALLLWLGEAAGEARADIGTRRADTLPPLSVR